jgi:hypothetical protein
VQIQPIRVGITDWQRDRGERALRRAAGKQTENG